MHRLDGWSVNWLACGKFRKTMPEYGKMVVNDCDACATRYYHGTVWNFFDDDDEN